MDPRKHLIELVRQLGMPSSDAAAPLPVVPLEAFFTLNDDLGSIGCNLAEHPGPQRFYELLSGIRSKPVVEDVLVEINEVDETDPDVWPLSERVYVLTSADDQSVAEWLAELQPDSIEEGWAYGTPRGAPAVVPPNRVWGAWWD